MRLARSRFAQAAAAVCLAVLIAVRAPAADPAGSVVLLDFEDDAQFARLRLGNFTRAEPSSEAVQGKRSARVVYSAVPEGARDFPAMIVAGDGLRVRDLSPFEAISLWVLNPGPEDAELSLAIWDRDGNRGFPSPSTVVIKPGRWQQVVSRLVLHGLDAKQIDSVHFYQKVNRRPVTLLIDDVRLLTPDAGRFVARLQAARADLRAARANADAVGAAGQIEPKLVALAQRLDRLEDPAGTAAERAQRVAELARTAAEARELAGAVRVRNNGKNVSLFGPQVDGRWLADRDRLRGISTLALSRTAVRDEDLAALAAAPDLERLVLDDPRITGAGLDRLPGDKLRGLLMTNTGAHDDALKAVGKFRGLRELHLARTRVTGGIFQHLHGLDRLTTLVLDDTNVSDAGFADIARLTSLESLNLERTRITGESLRHLAGLTRLKGLDLGHTKIDDAGVAHLGTLTRLESLSLKGTPITGRGFEKLGGLTKLVELNLNGTRVGDSGLRHLGLLRGLQRLELSATRITDASLAYVGRSARLEYINLYGTNITDAGLAHIRGLTDLQELYLGGTQTSDTGLAHLQNLHSLEHLDLEGTQVTDAGLAHIRGLRNLVSLKLGKTRVTNAGLVHLAGLSRLQLLDLSGTGVTDDGLADLARLVNLRTLLLGGTRITGKGLPHLGGAKRLVELGLEATDVGDDGLGLLATLPNLRRLDLSETAVTDNGLRHLARAERLQSLGLNHTRVTDDGLAHLRDGFTSLELAHTRVTDRGVEYLRRGGQLARLRLAATGITNDALNLLQATPTLTRLDLAETRIDDAGLRHLTALPELQELTLDGTPVSDRGIDSLLKLPGLRQVSLENARVTAQGASYLRSRSPELKLDLVFPWVWGERWTYYDIADPPDPAALVQQLQGLTSLGYLRLDAPLLRPEVLRSLKDFPSLEHLSFQGAPLTDDMLAELLGLSQVVRLDLSDTRVTDRGLVHLKDMRGLRELSLQGTRVTGGGLVHLTGLTRLQSLSLRDTPTSDTGLSHLAALSDIRKLELGGTRLTDAGLDHLLRLPGLQYLDLYGTAVTDAGAERLSGLTALRYCYLSNTRVTDAGISHLSRLTDLEELGLDGTRLTDGGLAALRPLSGLRRLRLGRTQITDAALDTLGALPSLTELDLRDTAVTPDALVAFRQAHPSVVVISGNAKQSYSPWSVALAVVYGLAVLAICVYGLHRYWLTWLFVRTRQVRASPEPKGRFDELPTVTVQLPMFNERHVAERIIAAACALDYPCDRLQIQVLDDSTDESAEIARRCCERMAALGHPIEYRHRVARDGFKGGALAAGLETATGEFVAVFDADFVPAPDFLRRTIDYFTDPKVGAVQANWSHLNRHESLLTELQAMFLDGHFVVEQAVRSRTGRWFNFNGTAGVWRRRSIDEAGGWQHDTLTEDTDLSYRAQLAGWTFLFLPTVRCDGELPATMTAFLGQQHRWTKGLIQTGRKLLPRILVSRAPLRAKLEAWFHLSAPLMYLVMFVVTVIALPALFLATPFTDREEVAAAVGAATLLLGTFAATTFYAVSQRAQGFPLGKTLLKIPLLMALGIGLCAVNARAVLGGLLGLRSPFVRTPKFGGRRDYPDAPTRRRHLPMGLVELTIAGVLLACLGLSFVRPFGLIGAPFLLLFAAGYAGVGLLRLLDRSRPARLAVGTAGVVFLAGITAIVFTLASPPTAPTHRSGGPVSLGLDLTTAGWQGGSGAIRRVTIDRGSLVLDVRLDATADQGELALDLDGAMKPLGDSLGAGRVLAFTVEYPSRFTGEFQAFVKDGRGRSEYGSAEFIESHDPRQVVTVSLVPGPRVPPMGYQDTGFDPSGGIRRIGLKVSAQSDRVRGPGYRPFRGTIRVTKVRVTDVDPASHPEPEVLPPDESKQQTLPVLTAGAFLAASGVDRPWPLGYAFSGPITAAHEQELDRTYAAVARRGCRFTRVYLGDYRTGLIFNPKGEVAGVEPEFLEYVDRLAEVANRHGVTVMFSLTDNTLADGRGVEAVEFIRAGSASEAFVNNALAAFVAKLRGRQVIWDVFNEPENVTAVPLRDVQRYVDRVLTAGRRANPAARFTVVSRSRPDLVYWQGRGLDLYSHNIFTARSLEESLAAPRVLDAPVMVAEMAPDLATAANLTALREAGYAGVGIWGWGTNDKYQWAADDLAWVTGPLARHGGGK
jgi:cellulose synthase/poly-beta-1,6-N-acetylglucosamine synthase-like glycosyltransferase/Leucine-rich repeat (LRR) protein